MPSAAAAPPGRPAGRNGLLALALFGFSAATYAYVMHRVGPNLNDELEAEASRQEAAERRLRTVK